jgi:hypothetical protein
VEDELAAPALVAEFLAKEVAFRDVHRRVFMNAFAADKIASETLIRPFVGSGGYDALNITRPDHVAFRTEALLPEVALRARLDDGRALERDADELAHRLRNMEI